MKYISIDLETSGIDPDTSQILEIGAVIDDLSDPKPLEELPTFQMYVSDQEISGNAYALQMNHEILKRIATAASGYTYCPIEILPIEFANWVQKFTSKDECIRGVNVAGKNFAMFDYPFLKAARFNSYIKFNRRIIDPAVLFYEPRGDKGLPDLATALKRAGLEDKVRHNAVDDAIQVVQLLRHKLI